MTLNVNVPRTRNEILGFVNTFSALLATSDEEINEFVKNTHSSNSGRANNARILIPPNVPISFKAILFELNDRQICDALPGQAVLGAIGNAQLNITRRRRADAKQHQNMMNVQSHQTNGSSETEE